MYRRSVLGLLLAMAALAACRGAKAEDAPATRATSTPSPAGGGVSFAVTSDHMEELPGNLVRGLLEARPRLVVLTGDMVFEGRENDFRVLTRVLLDPLRQAAVDWYPVIGNHDFPVDPNWKRMWGERKGRPYYSFDSGPAHFIILDTNRLAYAGRKFKQGAPEAAILTQGKDIARGSDQYNWLVADLQKTSRKFLFVFQHEPVVSSGDHGSSPAIQRTLCPLFEKHGVTAGFAGHEHAYQRFSPIRIDLTDEKKPVPVADAENGVVYITTGSGPNGRSYDVDASPLHAFRKEAATFIAVTVEGDTARGKAIELPSLKVIDTFEIKARR